MSILKEKSNVKNEKHLTLDHVNSAVSLNNFNITSKSPTILKNSYKSKNKLVGYLSKQNDLNNPIVDYGYKSMLEKANLAKNNKRVLTFKQKQEKLIDKQAIFNFYNDFKGNRFFNKKKVDYSKENMNLKLIQDQKIYYIPKNEIPYLQRRKESEERNKIIRNRANHEKNISEQIHKEIIQNNTLIKSLSLSRIRKDSNIIDKEEYTKLMNNINKVLKIKLEHKTEGIQGSVIRNSQRIPGVIIPKQSHTNNLEDLKFKYDNRRQRNDKKEEKEDREYSIITGISNITYENRILSTKNRFSKTKNSFSKKQNLFSKTTDSQFLPYTNSPKSTNLQYKKNSKKTFDNPIIIVTVKKH
jgi:hypothetical protein